VEDALGAVQHVLVLGGTSEIAEATVRRLARDRCRRAVLAVRDVEAAAATAAGLRDAGVEIDLIAFDATEVGRHAEVIDDAFARLGDVDLVLLAFGVLGDQASFEADPATAAEVVAVNLGGAVSAGLLVAERLEAQGHGTLAVLSSVAGERVRAENAVYGATKAGLDGFALALGDRLVGTGARVMVVRPGFVHTRMTAGLDPAPLSTTADAVADDIATGLRRRADVVWSPGTLRWLFSGLRHLPRPLWRRVSAAR
jgi:decaprenylphospho-beta-D-erythro-pentofuranosid-2-ulose 2-reductase